MDQDALRAHLVGVDAGDLEVGTRYRSGRWRLGSLDRQQPAVGAEHPVALGQAVSTLVAALVVVPEPVVDGPGQLLLADSSLTSRSVWTYNRQVDSTGWPDDLDGLLGPALGFAQQQLDKYGEFYPYAAVADRAGQQRMVAVDADNEHPQSADLITALVNTLSAQREDLRATAIVAEVGDAIRVTLEHVEQTALTVLLPSQSRRLGRGMDYGTLRVSTADALIWPTE